MFAVPGPVGSEVSKGCHRLIQQGAGLLTSAEDLLQEMRAAGVVAATTETKRLVSEEKPSSAGRGLLSLFAGQVLSAEELVRLSGMAEAEVFAELALLELKGFVRREVDGYIASP